MGSALSKLASGFRQAGSFLSRCITNSRLYRSARDTFSRRSRAVDVEHGASNEPHSQQNEQIAFVTLPPVGPLHELANNLVGLNDPHNFDEGEESPTEDEGINSDLALTASSDDEWEDNVATNPDLPASLPPQLDTGTRGLANPDGIVSRHHIFSPRPDESERNRKRNRGRSRQETYVRRRPYWCTSYEWKIPHIEGKLCSGNTSDDIEEDLESFPAFLKPYLNRPVVVYLREAHHKRNKALSNMSKEYNHLIRNVHYLRVYFRHHPMMSGVQKIKVDIDESHSHKKLRRQQRYRHMYARAIVMKHGNRPSITIMGNEFELMLRKPQNLQVSQNSDSAIVWVKGEYERRLDSDRRRVVRWRAEVIRETPPSDDDQVV